MKAEAKKSSNSPSSPPGAQEIESGIDAASQASTNGKPVNGHGEFQDVDANTLAPDTNSLLNALAEDPIVPALPPKQVTEPGQAWPNRLIEGSSGVMKGLSLDERWGRILLSAVLAVLLWFYVTGLENPSQATIFRGLQLEVRNLDTSLKIVNTEPLPKIDVSFQAPQNVLSSLSSTDIHPFIDLSDRSAGVHRLPISVDFNGGIGNTVSNLSITPPNYQVQLEVQASETYSVAVSVIGTPAFGYGADPAQVEPQQVTISGSASTVKRIARVVVEVDVDEKAATQRGFNIPVALDSSDQPILGLTIDPPTVQVTVPIKLLLSNRLVPVRVPIEGNPAPGYSVDDIKIEPTNVLICCAPGDILENVNSVTTQPVSIDGTTTTVLTNTGLILPAGVQLYPGQSSTITVTVSVRTFDTTWRLSVTPNVQGLPPDYTAVTSPTSLDLTLSGTFAQFQALTTSDVQANINGSNLGAGTYELTPDIVIPQGIRLVATNPTTVTISVIAPTPVPPTPTNTPTNTPTATAIPTADQELSPTPTVSVTTTPTVAPTATITVAPTFPPSLPPTNSPAVVTPTQNATQAPPTASATLTPTLTLTATPAVVPTATVGTE